MEPRRAQRRIETEDDAHRRRDADGDDDGPGRDEREDARLRLDDLPDAGAEDDPDDAADAGERDRLDEELHEDVAPACSDGLADPDLAGPLRDRHEHDVHDPDPAY